MVTSFNGTSHIYIDSMSQHGENPQILEMKNQPLEGTMFMCPKKATLPETNIAPDKRCLESPPPKTLVSLNNHWFSLSKALRTYTWNLSVFGIENMPCFYWKTKPHGSFGLLNLESKWVVWKHPPNSRVWKGRENPGGFKGKRGNGETFVLQCIYT